MKTCLQQIPGGDDRVPVGVREGFLSSTGRQVEDDPGVFGDPQAIVPGEQVAFNDFHSRIVGSRSRQILYSVPIGRWSNQAADIIEPTLQQTRHDPLAHKTAGTRHEDSRARKEFSILTKSV